MDFSKIGTLLFRVYLIITMHDLAKIIEILKYSTSLVNEDIMTSPIKLYRFSNG